MKIQAASLALAGLLAVTGGEAQAQQGRTDPAWSQPARADIAAQLYPGFASMLGEEGRVELECRIEADGHPYLCEVVEEMPQGMGFGAAARVVVASSEVRAARLDGMIMPSQIRTRVNFQVPSEGAPVGGWKGPEPTPMALRLARKITDEMMDSMPERSFRQKIMGGLDHDRLAVVGPWITELFPQDDEADRAAAALQFARLFSERDLRKIQAHQPVAYPSDEAFYNACPDPTPEQSAALDELRRRYCNLYECNADTPAPG